MAEHGRDAKHLGRTLSKEPQAFPREVGGILRRSLHRIWKARGGGLYACGFVVTFLILETRMLLSDIIESDSVGSFLSEQAFEMVFRYFSESIVNTVYAFIWPVYVIQFRPPWGLAALAATWFLFDRFLKAWIGQRLFGGDRSGNGSEGA